MEEYLKLLSNAVETAQKTVSFEQYTKLKQVQSSMLYECLTRCNNAGGDAEWHRSGYTGMSTDDLLNVIKSNNKIIQKIEMKIEDKRHREFDKIELDFNSK